jgi:hypothetical protein
MNGEKHEVKVAGYYNPIAATVWTFFEGGIVWPDGTNNIPSDSRTVEHDCPFPDDDIQASSNGENIAYIVNFIVIGITGLMTLVIWR